MNKMKEFFSLLDLSKDELKGVKEKVDQKNYPDAGAVLLDYYRKRQGVNYYDGWNSRPLGEAFDTTKAEEICDNYIVFSAITREN